jgi:hypothetical protein
MEEVVHGEEVDDVGELIILPENRERGGAEDEGRGEGADFRK